MRRFLAVLPLLFCACKPMEESHMKVVIGTVMMDGMGGPPVSGSVVVVAGSTISEVGSSSNVPIPEEADKIDGSGRYLVPGLVDVCPQAEPSGIIQTESAEEARTRVKGPVIYIGKSSPAAAQAALEAARDAGIPALGMASTSAEVQFLVDKGATGIVGIMRDAAEPDAALLARLRDLRIVVAPSLASIQAGPDLENARRNTRLFFAAGVLIAAASRGSDILRETEALADAGIPPMDVVVAATRNGAMALRKVEKQGTIQPGKIADMLLLSANPGEDIRNLRRVAGRLTAGQWSPK